MYVAEQTRHVDLRTHGPSPSRHVSSSDQRALFVSTQEEATSDMRKSKYTEEQIIGFLRQVEVGMPMQELGPKQGFSDASFYKWRAKYGGMNASEAKRLKKLELLMAFRCAEKTLLT